VPELIAKSPLAGQLPVTHGTLTLAEVVLDRITAISARPGDRKLAKALKDLGLAFPEPNQSTGNNGARLVWTGQDQAFLINADPGGLVSAVLTDQSDGWACLRLAGPDSAAALMRLVPLDLRAAAMPAGRAARAPLNHMNMLLIASDAGFDILVYRSMARTAWHEIETAMKSLAARKALRG
jgi:heterotetrameric sarcosine oxidase gamma subunit